MKEHTNLEKQQYQRMIELSDLARQRYLESGGDPHHSADDKYLTAAEKKEFFALGRLVFGVTIKDNQITCQGRSWKLPIKPQLHVN
ncbi:MAG: hypothetical protein GDA44_07755 [Prochloron sp. SP5CPC1]|nr:hypothetical protein [Candidatus Paraprochloron terpiosi SP5CPC1]